MPKYDETDLKWIHEALKAAQQSPYDMSASVAMFNDMIDAIKQKKTE
jgi:hypothetical protein